MQKKSFLFISGIISFFIYIFICFIFIYYIVSPKTKTFNIKTKQTVIQLDMIIEKSNKKRVAKKEKIKENKKDVDKSASISNKKRPDLKSLFGNVKTKDIKVKKEEVNNVKKSVDPKRFKAKFEREKKSSNVKIDKILDDKLTTTNVSSKNLSKNDESDEYFSKINEMLSVWTPTTREENLIATIIINISPSGEFSYRFIKFSENISFDQSLKAFLEEQKSIIYPKPKKGKTVTISVNFRSEG